MKTLWKFIFLGVFMLTSCSPVQPPRQVDSQMTPSMPVSKPTQPSSPAVFLSPTAPSTLTPTQTVVPALSIDQAEAKVIELLRDNGGCRLPCFWGFTPGLSNILEALSFQHLFSNIEPNSNGIIISRDELFLKINLVISGMMGDEDSQTIRHINVSMNAYTDETIPEGFVHGSPYFSEYFRYYTLPFLLSHYGPPENAYIGYENQMGLENLYTLVLDYTSSGWIVRFDMDVEEGPNPLEKTATGCPHKAFITLYLWEPTDTATRNYYYGNNFREWISLEKATGLTLNEFYKQYKDPANTKCLQTPTNVRP